MFEEDTLDMAGAYTTLARRSALTSGDRRVFMRWSLLSGQAQSTAASVHFITAMRPGNKDPVRDTERRPTRVFGTSLKNDGFFAGHRRRMLVRRTFTAWAPIS